MHCTFSSKTSTIQSVCLTGMTCTTSTYRRVMIFDIMTTTVPSCGGRPSCTKTIYAVSMSGHASLRGGWRSPLHCLQCRRFWGAEFAQKHTDQTWWRWHLCCLHLPSRTAAAAPLTELHLSTVSVESCGQTAAWEPSGSGWHSSPDFWTGRRNQKTNM